jgi:hypothetical protein
VEVESARRWWGRGSIAVAGLVVFAMASCSGTDGAAGTEPSVPPATLPLADRALDDPDVTTVASDLAPSQTGESTVPEPTSPDPCRGDDVEMWTARVAPSADTAVIRMRNVSDAWCEPDIGRSPLLDPAIEPDVWLLPAGSADLVVGPDGSECAEPAIIDRVQVGVGTDSVVVPTALVTCGWWLTAFYPNDTVQGACALAGLDVAVAEAAVVVRNASPRPCAIGGLVDVAGAPVAQAATAEPAVFELWPGDVASFGAPGEDGCEGVHELVVLTDGAVGEFAVADVPCEIEFELGAASPWFGTAKGPPARLPAGAADPADMVEALDPFAGDE